MERTSFLLLLILNLILLSHLPFSITAVPSTRLESLQSETQVFSVETTEEVVMELDGRRMDLEINDYAGSGANNRHIPRPPTKK